MFVEANGYTCIYTHIKAKLKVDGSFLFSLLKDKNKNNFYRIWQQQYINKNNSFIPRYFGGLWLVDVGPASFFGWTRSDRAVRSPTHLIVITAEGDGSSNDSFVWIIIY